MWAREPFGVTVWLNARFLCAGASIGGRNGWRLPSLHELSSLLDPGQFDPALSKNHPFKNVSSERSTEGGFSGTLGMISQSGRRFVRKELVKCRFPLSEGDHTRRDAPPVTGDGGSIAGRCPWCG